MDRKNLRIKYAKNHPDEDISNKQAHHVIPVQVLTAITGKDESELSENYNEDWNCLMLPTGSDDEYTHQGSHGNYSNFVYGMVLEELTGCSEEEYLHAFQSVALVIKTAVIENYKQLKDFRLNGRIDDFDAYMDTIAAIIESQNNASRGTQ